MSLRRLLTLIGIAIWLGSPFNGVSLTAFVALITAFQIAPGEAQLLKLFSSDHECHESRSGAG